MKNLVLFVTAAFIVGGCAVPKSTAGNSPNEVRPKALPQIVTMAG